jgi:hypothetical protein
VPPSGNGWCFLPPPISHHVRATGIWKNRVAKNRVLVSSQKTPDTAAGQFLTDRQSTLVPRALPLSAEARPHVRGFADFTSDFFGETPSQNRGTGPAMQDLQGGRIDYLCEIISTAKPQIDAIRRSLCSPRCSQAASISTDAYLVPAAPPLRPDIISEWV